MNRMRIGVIGNGVVGSATARSLMEYADVFVHDVVPERSVHALAEVTACDIVFVCLPTPQKEDTLECDTIHVNSFFAAMYANKLQHKNWVLRSTVPVGTTSKIRRQFGFTNLVHSPEFLTARCSFTDAQVPARNIIGGEPCDCRIRLKELYEWRFPGTQCLVMSSDESEAVKNCLNAFFAVKLSFFNEIEQFCTKLGLDWMNVLRGMLSDGRIAQSHCNVPGPDGKYGYGGTCLPKDTASLVSQMCDAALEPTMCMASLQRNRRDRERKS